MRMDIGLCAIRILFRLYGIELSNIKGTYYDKLLLVYGALINLFQLLFLFIYILLTIDSLTKNSQTTKDFYLPVAFVATYAVSTITHLVLRNRRHEVRHLLWDILGMAVKLQGRSNKNDPAPHVRNRVIVFGSVAAVHFALYFITSCALHFALLPSDDELALKLKNTTQTPMFIGVGYVLINKYLAVFMMWAYSFDVLGFVTFAYVCAVTNMAFTSLKDVGELLTSTNRLGILLELYRDLARLVERANGLFSALLAIWCGVWVAKCCLWIRAVKEVPLFFDKGIMLTCKVLGIFLNFYFFVGTALLASRVNFQVETAVLVWLGACKSTFVAQFRAVGRVKSQGGTTRSKLIRQMWTCRDPALNNADIDGDLPFYLFLDEKFP